MSLFQVREWWQINCTKSNEEYDQHHMLVGNIDGDPQNVNKILIASLNGMVQIYSPSENEYKIEHLIFEQQLKYPILQIEMGHFLSSDAQQIAIAILHPRMLAVYEVVAVGNQYGSKAQYYELNKKYHHKLDRNAFNFIYGPFADNRKNNNSDILDSICVQSIDGKFWVFAQEHFSFSRDWNNFLIPGCMCYLPLNDSIITATADMKLYSYSYAVLSTAAPQHSLSNSMKNEQSSFHKNWCLNIGDHVLNILCAKFTPNTISSSKSIDIIVLCEHNLYAISCNGQITWQIKLDYNPSTIAAYAVVDNHSSNLILGTFQNSIHIYSKCSLVWVARLHFSPINISVANFCDIQNMQIMLSDTGCLMISYLGTDPSGYKPVHIESRDINWSSIEQELQQTKQIIHQMQEEKISQPKYYLSLDVGKCNDSSIKWMDNGHIINTQYNDQLVCDSMMRLRVCSILLKIDFEANPNVRFVELSTIQLTIVTDDAFPCNQSQIFIEMMDNQHHNHKQYELSFYVRKTVLPSDRQCKIYITYFNADEKMQANSIVFQMPFSFPMHICPPIKNMKHIFTLEVKYSPSDSASTATHDSKTFFQKLLPTVLFRNLIELQHTSGDLKNNYDIILRTPQALTFMFYCRNIDITLLLSRKGGRIRIQSGDISVMWYIIQELVTKIKHLQNNRNSTENEENEEEVNNNHRRIKTSLESQSNPMQLQIYIKDVLPIDMYFICIEKRYQILCNVRMLESKLEKLSQQLLIVQKRLIMRYKNKNPTPMNQMNILLQKTYESMINTTLAIEENNEQLRVQSSVVANITNLLRICIGLKNNFNLENQRLLRSYLTSIHWKYNESADGYEEQIDAGFIYLLSTVLAKSRNDTKIFQHKFGKFRDIRKLNKHLRIICARIANGKLLSGEKVKI